MPISAVDTITLAFQHTKRQLIQPFRFWQWTRLAFVGLLAGEMASGGGCNFPTSGFNIPHQSGPSRHLIADSFPKIDPAILGGLIATLVISALVFIIVMAYISSVMRFVLFDSVLTKECRIREVWSRRQGPGWNLFLWHLAILVVTLVGFLIIVGIPAALAFAAGWFTSPRDHLAPLILLGMTVFFFFLLFSLAGLMVQVLTKDFVVPQMALEGLSALEGWRRLWQMMQLEKGGYAIYLGMKVVLAIGAGIVVGLASFILALLFAVPAIGVVVVGIIGAKSAGFVWNAATITAAIVAGCVLFAVFFYMIALISVPVIVFFPAYSIYFFAPRYRPLSLALYPPPPPTFGNAPPEPPPLPPYPQPV